MVKRGRPIGSISRPRDLQGLLIPTEGSVSRMVYEMLKIGLETHEMAQVLCTSKTAVHRMIFRIRHPEQTKDQHREYMSNRQRTGPANVSP